MPQSYRQISPQLARQIKLVMTNVDGTITTDGDSISSIGFRVIRHLEELIRHLEEQGIIVGLVSGRPLPELESLAHDLGITGSIIAENGGVTKLKVNGRLMDLGAGHMEQSVGTGLLNYLIELNNKLECAIQVTMFIMSPSG